MKWEKRTYLRPSAELHPRMASNQLVTWKQEIKPPILTYNNWHTEGINWYTELSSIAISMLLFCVADVRSPPALAIPFWGQGHGHLRDFGQFETTSLNGTFIYLPRSRLTQQAWEHLTHSATVRVKREPRYRAQVEPKLHGFTSFTTSPVPPVPSPPAAAEPQPRAALCPQETRFHIAPLFPSQDQHHLISIY